MLILSRMRDEQICIGADIVVTVTDIRGEKVRRGIAAPAGVKVDRAEVRERKGAGGMELPRVISHFKFTLEQLEIVDASTFHPTREQERELEELVSDWIRRVDAVSPVRRCRACGCTDDDCRQCLARTGRPCHWAEKDLCSACVGADSTKKTRDISPASSLRASAGAAADGGGQ